MNIKSAFAKRVVESGLTIRDVSVIANVSYKRVHLHSMGRLELTPEEMERVNAAIAHAAVVYTIYRRELGQVKSAVTISTGKDGVMKVTAEA